MHAQMHWEILVVGSAVQQPIVGPRVTVYEGFVSSFVQGRGRTRSGLTGHGACCSLVGNAKVFLACLGSFRTPGGQTSASVTVG